MFINTEICVVNTWDLINNVY